MPSWCSRAEEPGSGCADWFYGKVLLDIGEHPHELALVDDQHAASGGLLRLSEARFLPEPRCQHSCVWLQSPGRHPACALDPRLRGGQER